ncbi:hypothetical protein OC834_001921 [Tilletia horrida]|uniref:Ras-GAP domain-containing protein n=1 Tax=Tilletia horrida TaxID=155126 RepID=A0AAN6GCB0_9BASI|nr:hypothetical protein OC842_002913 [Tilletia horrida]KAK0534352.1 hypothetical protein OC834_001921 [Tilletia horrida]KAK0537711.1 hypothetical protein OC835_001683 [Tilletia horrida]KAK0559295.1 hypothetical protein OC844_004503 [Tilletia horrida]
MPSLGAAFQPESDLAKEQPAVYQSVLIWQHATTKSTGARAALTKAPIIRDVPQVRRKLASRNSTSGPRFDPTLSTPGTANERGLVSLISRPTQTWLREKPSRAKLSPTVSNVHASGSWKRGTLHFRDHGNLLIYSEEQALLHSIACEDLLTTHIRKVDSSLFGRNNAMGIFATPSTLTQLSPRARLNTTTPDEPIYLCFYSRANLHKWLYLLRIYAQPEVYGSPLSAARGGTHRFYRHMAMKIDGVRFVSPDSSALFDAYMTPSASGTTPGVRPASAVPGGDRDFDLLGAKEDAVMQCYCVVRHGSYAVARTKVFSTNSSQLWLEEFSVGDLAPWTTLTVEVMQAHRGKTALVGIVDLTVQTMRRGEPVEGWFPIWSTTRAAREHVPISTIADPASAYSRELAGELKLTIQLRDEVVMPRKRYNDISRALNSEKWIPLISSFTKVLDERAVLERLVDVFASSGTIVDRMAELTEIETNAMNDQGDGLDLLFRGNSLLSRALNEYQKKYCVEWLFDSIGLFIINICSQRIVIDTPLASDDSANGGTGTNNDASGGAVPGALGVAEGEVRYLNEAETIAHFKDWTRTLWQSIYGARNKCPPDLRRMFANIRSKVDSKFEQHESSVDPGKRAVGAIAFLRLICPAIAAPHLYGVSPSAPEPRTSRILTILAKIILSLANKRSAFDKDTWLAPMTDFLKTQAVLLDDYINTISTEPPENVTSADVIWGDDDEGTFGQSVQHKIARLYPIHRESIPQVNFVMDEPLALATFTSYIARNVPAELVDEDVPIISSPDGAVQLDLEALGEEGDRLRQFARHACHVEEHAGYYVDKAGYDSLPLEFAEKTIKHHNQTSSLATVSVGKTSTPASVASPKQLPRTSPGRKRGATVSASGSGTRDSQRIASSTVDEGTLRSADGINMGLSAGVMGADYGTNYDSEEELRAAYRAIKDQAASPDEVGASTEHTYRPHSSEGLRFASIGANARHMLSDDASLGDDDASLNGVGPGGNNPESSVTSLPRYGGRNKKWWKLGGH